MARKAAMKQRGENNGVIMKKRKYRKCQQYGGDINGVMSACGSNHVGENI
jgi:hypothetical protein